MSQRTECTRIERVACYRARILPHGPIEEVTTMDARALFLADHSRIHAAAISAAAEMAAAGGFTMQDDALKRLQEADLRANPEGLCSIVWHVWHMTRIEDVVANVMLRGQREVLDRDGWLDRLGV